MMSSGLGLCLVTGATGFVGRVLVEELLSLGLPVRVMARQASHAIPACETVYGEMVLEQENYADVLAGVDTVFHLAGIAHATASIEEYEYQCKATLALARQAAVLGVRGFIYVSSTKAAMDKDNPAGNDDSLLCHSDPYGYWKRQTEKQLLGDIHIPHISILRPCLIYGAGVKGNLLAMLRAIDGHYFPPLPETGAVRSMVCVTDVAKALVLLATHPEANRHIFVASDGQAYTAHRIYCAMRKALGYPDAAFTIPVWLLRCVGFFGDLLGKLWPSCPVSSAAIDRLTGAAVYSADRLLALGWMPFTTLEQELPSMLVAYRKAAE